MEYKFTHKQQRFMDEYLVDFNATRAATKAGYSSKTARNIGSALLANVHVKAEIERRISELQLGPDQTKKLISDIARGNLSDYMKIVKVERRPKIKKHLSEVIADLQAEIDFEEEYATRANLEGDAIEEHEDRIASMMDRKLRLQIELEKNPDAFRIVSGAPELVEEMELDIVALAKDRERGKIKSFTYTKDGPKIELYPADAALRDIAKIHGLFIDKKEITGKDGKDLFESLADDDLNQLIDDLE